jgi:hypothetical protein
MKAIAHAKKLTSASINLGGDEGKIEKVLLKESGQEQIRLSLWSQGKMQRSPLSLSEQELVALLQAGIQEGVLSREFIVELHSVIEI